VDRILLFRWLTEDIAETLSPGARTETRKHNIESISGDAQVLLARLRSAFPALALTEPIPGKLGTPLRAMKKRKERKANSCFVGQLRVKLSLSKRSPRVGSQAFWWLLSRSLNTRGFLNAAASPAKARTALGLRTQPQRECDDMRDLSTGNVDDVIAYVAPIPSAQEADLSWRGNRRGIRGRSLP